MSDELNIEQVIAEVKKSRKYRDTSEETIRQAAAISMRQHKKPKKVIKAVRTQLHSIMAPYLGDPDYQQAAGRLDAAFASGELDRIKTACHDIMYSHLSTRERLPLLPEFYDSIFAITGRPGSILDVACGLNPLAFPWMGLELPFAYHAYDIHEPRIAFLNHYFALQGLPPLARLQDVAIRQPEETADLALFLKEMPRFERNYKGQGRRLLDALQVRHIVISFPTVSTHGGRNLTGRYREFLKQLLHDRTWPVTELLFEGELVFCVDKGG